MFVYLLVLKSSVTFLFGHGLNLVNLPIRSPLILGVSSHCINSGIEPGIPKTVKTIPTTK